MTENNDKDVYSIDASVDSISLTVKGFDETWVRDTFDDLFPAIVDEAEDRSTYHVGTHAGMLGVHGNAETPEDAFDLWVETWERILGDVKELTNEERERVGLQRQ